jgi:hypothetical protein
MAHALKRCGVSRSFPRRACEASLCTPQRLAPCKRWNRWYPVGLCGGCFNACVGQEKEGAQESNQQVLGSPGPGWTPCRLPMAPKCLQDTQHTHPSLSNGGASSMYPSGSHRTHAREAGRGCHLLRFQSMWVSVSASPRKRAAPALTEASRISP